MGRQIGTEKANSCCFGPPTVARVRAFKNLIEWSEGSSADFADPDVEELVEMTIGTTGITRFEGHIGSALTRNKGLRDADFHRATRRAISPATSTSSNAMGRSSEDSVEVTTHAARS
jgi:hypothetical protein